MTDVPKADSAQWVRPVLWAIALLVATVGIAVAIAIGSWWPVLLVAGLAVPLVPVGRRDA